MNSKVFIFILIIALIVSAGVVLFYAKRSPNPYFRPKRGEITLMSIIMLFIAGGTSFFLSTLFESDIDFQKMKESSDGSILSPSAGGGSPDERPDRSGNDGNSGGSTPDPALPPFKLDPN